MFKKKYRFSFRKGIPKNIFHSNRFVIRYGENKEYLKTAVVVGKKVDKKAVVRNKVKRQIVKILEELLDKEQKKTIIIFAKKQILETENNPLKEELRSAFLKANII